MLNEVVVVIRTRPRAISSAIFTMRKAGVFVHVSMGLHALRRPSGHRSSAEKKVQDRKGFCLNILHWEDHLQ